MLSAFYLYSKCFALVLKCVVTYMFFIIAAQFYFVSKAKLNCESHQCRWLSFFFSHQGYLVSFRKNVRSIFYFAQGPKKKPGFY